MLRAAAARPSARPMLAASRRHARLLVCATAWAVCVGLAVVPSASGQGRSVITGTEAGDDLVHTTPGQSFHLIGLGGDDTLTTGDGDDILEGGDGSDDLTAQGGDDLLEGGAGSDNLFAGDGDDRLDGGPDADDLVCGPGEDSVVSPDPQDFVSPTCERIAGQADLALSKSASPTSVSPGGTVRYTLTVTNLGPDAAMGVGVIDFPTLAISDLPAGCSPGAGQVTCERSELLFAGGTVSWTIGATAPTEAGSYENTAAISVVGTTDPNASNNFASASVQVLRPNQAPVATDDAYATAEDTPVTAFAPGVLNNDSDADGDTLSAVSVSGPSHGTLALNANGSFTYMPNPGFGGTDSFTYRAVDPAGAESAPATVTIDVQEAPDAIVFASSRSGNGDLYTLDLTGGALTQLTSGSAVDAEPAWSPDRGRVAFTSTRDGNIELYVIDADGSDLTRLTNHSAVDSSPAWSPDGSRIAFSSSRGPGRNVDVYIVNADGTNLARVTTHSAADNVPAWSPDGARIAFSSTRSGNGDIYAMSPNGTGQARLTSSPGIDTEPDWSPDSARVAFSTNRHGLFNFELYKMNSDGTNQTRLTNHPALDLTPVWSPDNTGIAFTSSRTGNTDIYTINPDGTNPTRQTNNPSLDLFPDW
jgi:uncharacterized repeat protein (TIGR01451 family)